MLKAMNILYTLNSGDPGGMEKHVRDLIKGMTQKGHKVFVWCCEGEAAQWYRESGADVVIRGINHDIDLKYIWELYNFVRISEIEVVHSHELKAVVNSTIAATLAGVKCRISHTHTPISEWQVSGIVKKIITFIERTLYAFLIDMIGTYEIALTETRKEVKRREGIVPAKIKVIPNALDFRKFDVSDDQRASNRSEIRTRYAIPESAFVIGNVSRITPEKGHEILVKAYTRFLQQIKDKGIENDYYLFIAGGGELENNIRVLVSDLNIQDRVIVTGIFEDADLVKFYNTFDLFVFPTLAEGFGYVLVEAMYCKLPVIASDLEVIKEVSKESILFFETNNYIELSLRMADTIKRMLKKEDFTSEPYRITEKLYSMQKFNDTYENLYLRVLLAE